jgi:hypothetical protein
VHLLFHAELISERDVRILLPFSTPTRYNVYGHVEFCGVREAKFCAVPSRVFDELGYATGKKK